MTCLPDRGLGDVRWVHRLPVQVGLGPFDRPLLRPPLAGDVEQNTDDALHGPGGPHDRFAVLEHPSHLAVATQHAIFTVVALASGERVLEGRLLLGLVARMHMALVDARAGHGRVR